MRAKRRGVTNLSTPTAAIRPVCRYCQTEITDRWEEITHDTCFACWIEPLADDEAHLELDRLQLQGLLPPEYIGC